MSLYGRSGSEIEKQHPIDAEQVEIAPGERMSPEYQDERNTNHNIQTLGAPGFLIRFIQGAMNHPCQLKQPSSCKVFFAFNESPQIFWRVQEQL